MGRQRRMTSIDHRPYLQPVRDQGERGTCLAFSATCAHEHARLQLEEQDELCIETLYWAAAQRMPRRTRSEEGLTIDAALSALEEHGQSTEDTWPYRAVRHANDAELAPPQSAVESLRKAGGRTIDPTPTSVREQLASGHVIVLGIRLWGAFSTADPATITIAPPSRGEVSQYGHAIVAVGCDDAGRLLLRNSWGVSWGSSGYAWADEQFLATAAICAAVIDGPVPMAA